MKEPDRLLQFLIVDFERIQRFNNRFLPDSQDKGLSGKRRLGVLAFPLDKVDAHVGVCEVLYNFIVLQELQ